MIRKNANLSVRQRVIVDHPQCGADVKSIIESVAMRGFIPVGFIHSWDEDWIDRPHSDGIIPRPPKHSHSKIIGIEFHNVFAVPRVRFWPQFFHLPLPPFLTYDGVQCRTNRGRANRLGGLVFDGFRLRCLWHGVLGLIVVSQWRQRPDRHAPPQFPRHTQ